MNNTKNLGFNKKYSLMWDDYVNSCFKRVYAEEGNEHNTMIVEVDKYLRHIERVVMHRARKTPSILKYKYKEE